MMLPLFLLYLLSIGFAAIAGRRPREEGEKPKKKKKEKRKKTKGKINPSTKE